MKIQLNVEQFIMFFGSRDFSIALNCDMNGLFIFRRTRILTLLLSVPFFSRASRLMGKYITIGN